MEAKKTAEEIQIIVKKLTSLTERISSAQSDAKKIKGGIAKNVQ